METWNNCKHLCDAFSVLGTVPNILQVLTHWTFTIAKKARFYTFTQIKHGESCKRQSCRSSPGTPPGARVLSC